MNKKIFKIGNSYAVILPKQLLDILKLNVSDSVNISLQKNNEIVIKKGE